MSDGIYNYKGKDYVISLKESMWHKKGNVFQERIGAVEGYNLTVGDSKPEYREFALAPVTSSFDTDGVSLALHPDFVNLDRRDLLDPGKKIIVQYDGDTPLGVVATVSAGWNLVTPEQGAYAWDAAMKELKDNGYGDPFIETMGFLQRSKVSDRFWIATKQQPINIKGDNIELYVTTYISMSDESTLDVFLTPVRTVCQNTWRLGQNVATERIQIAHSDQAVAQLRGAIQSAYLGLDKGITSFQDWMNVLAEKKVSEAQARKFAEIVYRDVTQPRENFLGKMSLDDKKEAWNRQQEQIKLQREKLLAGFSGGAIGYADTPGELHGTAYELFQLVTESVTHRPGRSVLRGILESTGGRNREVVEAEKVLAAFVKNDAVLA